MFSRTLLFLLFLFAATVFAEVPTNMTGSITIPVMGSSGSASLGPPSGTAGNAASTFNYSSAGLLDITVDSSSGSLSSVNGANRTGIMIDNKKIFLFDSFKTTNFPTVLSSGTTCPTSTKNYIALPYRVRSPNVSNGNDATANGFPAAVVVSYEPSYSPSGRLIVSGYSNLANINLQTVTQSYAALSTACSNGKFQVNLGSAGVFDQYATVLFGEHMAVLYTGGGSAAGNPRYFILFEAENLSAGLMSGFAGEAFSALYREYSSTTTVRASLLLYPDSAGTTYTIKELSSLSDPQSAAAWGTITLSSNNNPTTGFYSGTFSRQGVSGTGNIICGFSTQYSEHFILCSGQKPGDNPSAISIIGRVTETGYLAMSLGQSGRDTAIGSTGTIVATLTNHSGKPVSGGLADGSLSAPLSFTTGGTCGATIPAFSSCTKNIAFSPTAAGSNVQSVTYTYHNGSTSTTVTANLGYAGGLSSLAVTPSGSTFLPNSSQQLTATATYSTGATQNVTNSVTWTSSNTSVATIGSNGIALFKPSATGNVTFTATMGTSTASQTFTITNPTISPTTWTDTPTCSTATSKTITLSNPTSAALTNVSASISGSSLSIATNNCAATLNANSSCTIILSVNTPSTATGALTISHSAGSNSVNIDLPTCNTAYQYSISDRSGTAALGNLVANTQYEVTVRITNDVGSNRCFSSSNGPVSSISTNRATSASVVSSNCPTGNSSALANGSYCDIVVRFTTQTASTSGSGSAGSMSVSPYISPYAWRCTGAAGFGRAGFMTISGTIQ